MKKSFTRLFEHLMPRVPTHPLRTKRDLILCYHRLRGRADCGHRPGEFSAESRATPIVEFTKQMEWLSGFADFVTLDDMVRGRPRDQRRWRVAVTFDDGYYNNIEQGLPVFERFGIPITWFVASGFVKDKSRLPWWDFLDLFIANVRGAVPIDTGSSQFTVELSDDTAQRRRAQGALREYFRNRQGSEPYLRKSMENALAKTGITSVVNAFATIDEVSEAAEHPLITLGGHTENHVNCALVPPQELKGEIEKNIEDLERWGGHRPYWFAYPYGAAETYDQAATKLVQGAGYVGAVTVSAGYYQKTSPTYEIPRQVVAPNWSLRRFQSVLASVSTWSLLHKLYVKYM